MSGHTIPIRRGHQMNAYIRGLPNHTGFTMLEFMIAVIILGTLASIAIPAFVTWLPRYRLKHAANDLYANMQSVKMMAIRSNEKCKLIFSSAGNGSYTIEGPEGTPEKTVDFLDYDNNGDIGYGCGDATKSATVSGDPIPDDFISYGYNQLTFNPRGLGSTGYVYLSSNTGIAYAVGTWSAGVIVLKKWNDSKKLWE